MHIHVGAPDGWDILLVVAGHMVLHWVARNSVGAAVVIDMHYCHILPVVFLQHWTLGILG